VPDKHIKSAVQNLNTRNVEEGIEVVRAYLERALAEFACNRNTNTWIRDFATEFPNFFAPAALSILKTWDESPGQRFLASVVLRDPKFLRSLIDPWRYNRSEASALFKRLLAIDQALDVRLARCLPNRNGVGQEGFTAQMFYRALDILDDTSRSYRMVPILHHLIEYPDPRISAKAVLVIGRRLQNASWAARQLKIRTDNRMRANALEALWGIDGVEVRDLMRCYVQDENNRVAASAVYGLYLLHEPEIESPMLGMAKHPQPLFRSSAAWLIGKTQSQEYMPVLSSLVQDGDSRVRSSALKALLTVRQKLHSNGNEAATGEAQSPSFTL
jgi:hypothetical protein